MYLANFPHQDSSFFDLLEQHPDQDQRDNRGKKHSLPLVLTGVVMALLAGCDGNLSANQRHMKNHFVALCQSLRLQANDAISRPQLPRLLARVNYPLIASLIQLNYGLTLPKDFADWLSGDGKDLRSSIHKGQQRGEVCVSIVAQTEAVVAQAYYNGAKESERPAVASLLNYHGLLNKRIVLDALHLVPNLLEAIQLANVTYLIGMKANQFLLQRACLLQALLHQPLFGRIDAPLRAHGRIEERNFGCFSLVGLVKAQRWAKLGLATVVVVTPVRRSLVGVETARTLSYFVTYKSIVSQRPIIFMMPSGDIGASRRCTIVGMWSWPKMDVVVDSVRYTELCRALNP